MELFVAYQRVQNISRPNMARTIASTPSP